MNDESTREQDRLSLRPEARIGALTDLPVSYLASLFPLCTASLPETKTAKEGPQ